MEVTKSLRGFLDAIELVMETGFAITAFIAMFLNAVLGEEIEAQAKQYEGERVFVEGNDAGMRSGKGYVTIDASEKIDAWSVLTCVSGGLYCTALLVHFNQRESI